MESPTNHDVAPRSRDDDDNNMAYARRCVVMEIIKAETDYVTHLHDVIQVHMITSVERCFYTSIELIEFRFLYVPLALKMSIWRRSW